MINARQINDFIEAFDVYIDAKVEAILFNRQNPDGSCYVETECSKNKLKEKIAVLLGRN